MRFDWRIILIIFLFIQLFIGNDLSHHIRTSKMYNEMLSEKTITQYDDKFFFKENLFTYGIPAYIISGFLWFLTGPYCVDLLMFILFIITAFVVNEYCDNNLCKFSLMSIILFLVIWDSLIALFANTFFWMAVLLYDKGKRRYIIPLIISCLTHPFSLIASIYFIFKDRRNFIWWVPCFLFYLTLSFIFPKTNLTFYYTLKLILWVLMVRLILLIAPLLRKELVYKLGLVSLILCLAYIITVSDYRVVNSQELMFGDCLKGFPDLSDGFLKVVDYKILPVLAQLHKINATLFQGNFFENIPTRISIFINWTEQEYVNYLNQNNISHVLFCKFCVQKTNEELFFNKSMIEWENDYYTLYFVN